jgi:bifunctional non-homologous end joining protein LigD
MLCLGAERLPEGREWRYELKLDGFVRLDKAGRSALLWSRNQKNFARRFPGVVKALVDLPDDTVIEGEVAALDEQGSALVRYPATELCQRFRAPGSFPEPPRRLEGSEKTLAKAPPISSYHARVPTLPEMIRLP